MKKILTLLTVSILSFCNACNWNCICAQDHPKVAVVLSGGGAKGAAHVTALKVIEEAGIKPDMVVGTSMGALIGGLYCVGYTPEQLDTLLRNMDWSVILSDKPDPKTQRLGDRLAEKNFALTVPFTTKDIKQIRGGFVNGVNLGHKFFQLLYPYNDKLKSFNDLPIPFSCVAVDLKTGEPYEWHSGSLQDAMRSSMSIPGAFSPVEVDSMLLIDGGMRDNFPTDVAKRMGADIIIGVNLGDTLSKDVRGIGGVLNQLMSMAMASDKQRRQNIDLCDVYIKIDVSGYNAASFSKSAIDTLLERGTTSTMKKWDELVALRKRLDGMGVPAFEKRSPRSVISTDRSLQLEEKHNGTHSLYRSFAENSLGVSLHYDNRNNVSLLLGIHSELRYKKLNMEVGVLGKLGDHNFIKPQLSLRSKKGDKLTFKYEFYSYDVNIYDNTQRALSLSDVDEHDFCIMGSKQWRKALLQTGVEYNSITGTVLASDAGEDTHHNDHYWTYFADFTHNTMDNFSYPTRGHSLQLTYKMITADCFHDSNRPAHLLHFNFTHALKVSPHLFFTPRLDFRCIINEDAASALANLSNTYGGIADANILHGQRAFAGATRLHWLYDEENGNHDSGLLEAVDMRYEFAKNHYIISTFNMLQTGHKMKDTFDKWWYGGMAGYMYKSIIGPLSFQLHYSNMEQKLQALFSLGYVF